MMSILHDLPKITIFVVCIAFEEIEWEVSNPTPRRVFI